MTPLEKYLNMPDSDPAKIDYRLRLLAVYEPRTFAAIRISPRFVVMLRVLDGFTDGATAHQLAAPLGISPTEASKMLASLARRGFVSLVEPRKVEALGRRRKVYVPWWHNESLQHREAAGLLIRPDGTTQITT